MFPQTPSSHSSVGIPRPTKATRPNVLRKKELAKEMKKWHDIVCSRAAKRDYDGYTMYQCFHCKFIFPRDMVCGDHIQTRGSRPDLKLDPDNGVCSCMDCNRSDNPNRK